MFLFERVAKFNSNHPFLLTSLCIILTVIACFGLLRLKGEVTYQSLLPSNFPSIKALNHLSAKFGGISYESVLVYPASKTSDFSATDSRFIEFLVGLEDSISSEPGFSGGRIQTHKDPAGKKIPIIQHYLSPFVANIKSELKSRGFNVPLSTITNDTIKTFTGKDFREIVLEDYLTNESVKKSMVGTFITKDGKAALIMIKTGAKLSDKEQINLAQNLEKFFQENLSKQFIDPSTGKSTVSFSISGDATLARDFDRHIRNKTILLFAIAMAFVVIMLFLAFRRITDTVLPILFMIIGLIWTFGIMGWVGIRYSIASVAVMPLLLGTALTFVVPLLARYYEEIEHHFRSTQAVGKAVITVGVGIFLAAITNIFGFLVFQFGILPPLREFGLVCALGTIIIFALSITLLPAIMILRDRSYEKGTEQASRERMHFDGLSRRKRESIFARITSRILSFLSMFAMEHSTLLFIIFAILIVFGLAQIRGLSTDSDLRKLVPRHLPGILADFQIEKYFGGQQTDTVMVTGNVLSPSALKAILAFEDEVARSNDNLYEGTKFYQRSKITSLADAIVDATGGRIPASKEESEAAVLNLEQNGAYIKGSLLSSDGKSALISLNGKAAQSREEIQKKLSLLETVAERTLTPSGLKSEVGGITVLTNDMTKKIIPTETFSSTISLLLCAVALIVIFRSFTFGLITLTVAIAGVAAEVGFLSLVSWPLDVITSLTSALVIGIGVNFGILFTHRFAQELEKGGTLPSEAVDNTLQNLGRANVVAALATIVAFITIMFSDIVPLKRFGGVTAFAIGACLLTSLTLLPALLYVLSRHRQAKEECTFAVAEQT